MTQNLNVLGRKLALLSFLIGSMLFLLYYLTSFWGLFFAGYLFIAAAVIGNSTVLILILISAYRNNETHKTNLFTSILMLLNIPIALTYLWIISILVDIMRITFNNSTNSQLTSIEITGCEAKRIDKLDLKESETIWINIPHDCFIDIKYMIDGQIKNEVVEPYVTKIMGQKRDYKIGDPENLNQY